jgi:hypothetical protein
VANRGPEAARLHVLPTLWFRNTWSWGKGGPKPTVRSEKGAIRASHPDLGDYTLSCEGAPELLFTENESNAERLWAQPNATLWVKDAFHQYVVSGNTGAVNPAKTGTKAAARYVLDVPAGGTSVIRLRLSADAPAEPFGDGFDAIVSARLAMRGRGTHRPTITLLNARVALAVIALLGALLGGYAGQTETVAMQQPSGSAQAMAIPEAGSADPDGFQTQRLVSFLDSVDRWLEERGTDPSSAQRRAAPR